MSKFNLKNINLTPSKVFNQDFVKESKEEKEKARNNIESPIETNIKTSGIKDPLKDSGTDTRSVVIENQELQESNVNELPKQASKIKELPKNSNKQKNNANIEDDKKTIDSKTKKERRSDTFTRHTILIRKDYLRFWQAFSRLNDDISLTDTLDAIFRYMINDVMTEEDKKKVYKKMNEKLEMFETLKLGKE